MFYLYFMCNFFHEEHYGRNLKFVSSNRQWNGFGLSVLFYMLTKESNYLKWAKQFKCAKISSKVISAQPCLTSLTINPILPKTSTFATFGWILYSSKSYSNSKILWKKCISYWCTKSFYTDYSLYLFYAI